MVYLQTIDRLLIFAILLVYSGLLWFVSLLFRYVRISVTPPSEAMKSYVNAQVSNYFILFETKQIIDIAAKLKTC